MSRFALCGIALVVAACSTRGVPQVDGGGRDGTTTQDTRRAALEDACTYWADGVCWTCDGGKPGPVTIGCRAPNDCALFCTKSMPSDYEKCREGEPNCKGFKPPKGTLAGCQQLPAVPGRQQQYCCHFCPMPWMAATWAKSPDGICYLFCDSCYPAGFTEANLKCP